MNVTEEIETKLINYVRKVTFESAKGKDNSSEIILSEISRTVELIESFSVCSPYSVA